MVIPFKIEFKQNKPFLVDKFVRTEAELFNLTDEEIPVVKENKTLELFFHLLTQMINFLLIYLILFKKMIDLMN